MTYSKSIKLFFHIFIYCFIYLFIVIFFFFFFFGEILNLHGIYHYSTEIWPLQIYCNFDVQLNIPRFEIEFIRLQSELGGLA